MKEKIKKNKPKDFLIAALISFLPTVFIMTILRMAGFRVGSITGAFVFLGLFYLTLLIKEEIKNKFSSPQYLYSIKIGKLVTMFSLIFIVIPLSIYASWTDNWTGFFFLFFLNILTYACLISLPIFLITFFITALVVKIRRDKMIEKMIETRTKARMSELGLSPDKDWQKYYEIKEEEEKSDKLLK